MKYIFILITAIFNVILSNISFYSDHVINLDYLLPILFVTLTDSVLIFYFTNLLILTIDITHSISNIYYFEFLDLIKSIKFSNFYNLGDLGFFIISLAFFLLIFIPFLISKRKIAKSETKIFAIIKILILFSAIYFIDYINGSVSINDLPPKKRIISSNISTSVIRSIIIHEISKRNQVRNHENQNIMQNNNYLKTDSSSSQLLVIVESFGLPKSKFYKKKLETKIKEYANASNFTFCLDSTKYFGSTTKAEIREFAGIDNNYYDFLDNHNSNHHNTIFQEKKSKGYVTYGAHSFFGKMFERNIWWKNIGIDTVLFFENYLKDVENPIINNENPIQGADDAEMFKYFMSKIKTQKKVFAYYLSLNSHLPYSKYKSKNDMIKEINFFNSNIEVNEQFNEVLSFIKFIILSNKNSIFSKIRIVGDHSPPFYNEISRNIYSQKYVPVINLSKERIN